MPSSIDLYVGVDANNPVAYQSSDLPTIKSNLEFQYNRFKVKRKNIEFKFNMHTFDLSLISVEDKGKQLLTSSKVKTSSTLYPAKGNRSAVYRSSVMGAAIAKVKPTKGIGSTDRNVIKIDPNGSNVAHTEAHEVGHFFLYTSPDDPMSIPEHSDVGGVFKYESQNQHGVVIDPVEDVSKSNVKLILENVPEK